MRNAFIRTIAPEGTAHAEHDVVISERRVCIAYHSGSRSALHKTLAGPADKRWVQPQQLIARDELGALGEARIVHGIVAHARTQGAIGRSRGESQLPQRRTAATQTDQKA